MELLEEKYNLHWKNSGSLHEGLGEPLMGGSLEERAGRDSQGQRLPFRCAGESSSCTILMGSSSLSSTEYSLLGKLMGTFHKTMPSLNHFKSVTN